MPFGMLARLHYYIILPYLRPKGSESLKVLRTRRGGSDKKESAGHKTQLHQVRSTHVEIVGCAGAVLSRVRGEAGAGETRPC